MVNEEYAITTDSIIKLSKNTQKRIFKDMDKARTEKDVEFIYQSGLEEYFNVKVEHPFSCDGYLECDLENEDGKKTKLMLITEYKLDKDFMYKLDRSKVLIQVLYYLKKFESNGRRLPNVILVGDKDEVFVLHSNDIIDYLDKDIDWGLAPSEAPDKNDDLLLDIRTNDNINPFVFQINDSFNFRDVCTKIKDLTFNIKRHVRVTDNNMSQIFDYFVNNVIKDKNIGANEVVHIFMDLMLNPEDAHLNRNKKGELVLSNGTRIKVNQDNYQSFFEHYAQDYKPSERERFTEIADRLIEDTERRRKGEFYTPTIWVNEAHKMISEQFGDNWRDEYVVWDCAWGTGNLTRDYKFRELYCSTLNEGDLEIGKKYNVPGTGFNTHGAKFQYDFLNDDVEFFEELKKVKETNGYLEEKDFLGSKLYQVAPRLIRSLLAGKKLVFFINPPYSTGAEHGGRSKGGNAITCINKSMKTNKMGSSSQQLYAQFLYRISQIGNLFFDVDICIFAKSNFMTSSSFKKFRTMFLSKFNYRCGMLFQASHFADVKGVWGIDFSIWSKGINCVDTFKHLLKDTVDGTISTIGIKDLYNMDNCISCSDYIKEDIKGLIGVDAPQLGSGVNVKSVGCGTLIVDSYGYYLNIGNSVYTNSDGVCLFTSTCSLGHGISIFDTNILKVCSNFTARRLMTGKYANWINDKDEYMIPNIKHEQYKQWESDCIVYSLFNTASNQSSLRQIDYKDKKWDIKNEFFFMSVEEMMNLANEYCNEEVYMDIKEHGKERYVYKLLQEVELSEDAQAVLDKAIELTKVSFKHRKMFNDDKPDYHINTWDAGWYQIKGMLKEYMPNELKEFNEMYKALGDRMRLLVYELGFLKG